MGDSSFWSGGSSSHDDKPTEGHEPSHEHTGGGFWSGTPSHDNNHPEHLDLGKEHPHEHLDDHNHEHHDKPVTHLSHRQLEHGLVELGFEHKHREQILKTFDEHRQEHGTEHYDLLLIKKVSDKLARDTSDGIHAQKINKMFDHFSDKFMSSTVH